MKFSLTKDEVVAVVSGYLRDKFKTSQEFDCVSSPSYGDWEFAEMTEQYLAAKAKAEADMVEFRKKWEEQEAAKKATGDVSRRPNND